jgi:hypothetical protein
MKSEYRNVVYSPKPGGMIALGDPGNISLWKDNIKMDLKRMRL